MRLPEATRSLKKIIHLPNYILLKSISIIELCCRLDNAKTYTCFKATLGQYHINTVDHKFKNIKEFTGSSRLMQISLVRISLLFQNFPKIFGFVFFVLFSITAIFIPFMEINDLFEFSSRLLIEVPFIPFSNF